MQAVWAPFSTRRREIRSGLSARRLASWGLLLIKIKIQNSSEFSRKRGTKFTLSMDSRRKHRGCCCTPAHCTAAGNAGRARAYGISDANPSRGCRKNLSIFWRCTDCRRAARASAALAAANKTKSTNTAAIF